MKKFLLLYLFLGLAPFGFVNCSNPFSSPVVAQSERNYQLKNFNSIEIGYAYEVHIHKKNTFSITAIGESRDLDYVKVYQRGNQLVIRDDRRSNLFKYMNREKVIINIGMPELISAEISGAVKAEIFGFKEQDFLNLEASGASEILIHDLGVNKLNLESSGASNIKIKGSAYKFNLECSGASNIKAKDFIVRDSDIDISGASNVTVHVTESLFAKASGASNIYYSGNPKHLDTESHAASNIKKISE